MGSHSLFLLVEGKAGNEFCIHRTSSIVSNLEIHCDCVRRCDQGSPTRTNTLLNCVARKLTHSAQAGATQLECSSILIYILIQTLGHHHAEYKAKSIHNDWTFCDTNMR